MKRLAITVVALLLAAVGLAWGTAAPALAGTAPAPASALAPAPTPASALADSADPAAVASSLRLMPLGNSITDGVGSSTGNGYRGPLWDALAAEGHPLDFVGSSRAGSMSDPDNEGHSGWRIDEIAAIADEMVGRYRPNVVTVEIGTNDLDRNHEVETAPARLEGLIDQIVTAAPDATVLVASLVVSTSPTLEQHRAAFNARIPEIVQAKQDAGKHVRFVDMSALNTADLADSLHPNDSGYQKMADAFGDGVRQADADGWIHDPVPTDPTS